MADRSPFDPFARDPWQILDNLRREMDQIFAGAPAFSSFGPRTRPTWGAAVFPAVNLYDSGGAFVLTAELPGVRAEDLRVEVTGNVLRIQGRREVAPPAEGAVAVHRAERRGGTFSRAFELPADIDPEGVEARLDHGVLILRVPKRPELQSRRIEVKPV